MSNNSSKREPGQSQIPRFENSSKPISRNLRAGQPSFTQNDSTSSQNQVEEQDADILSENVSLPESNQPPESTETQSNASAQESAPLRDSISNSAACVGSPSTREICSHDLCSGACEQDMDLTVELSLNDESSAASHPTDQVGLTESDYPKNLALIPSNLHTQSLPAINFTRDDDFQSSSSREFTRETGAGSALGLLFESSHLKHTATATSTTSTTLLAVPTESAFNLTSDVCYTPDCSAHSNSFAASGRIASSATPQDTILSSTTDHTSSETTDEPLPPKLKMNIQNLRLKVSFVSLSSDSPPPVPPRSDSVDSNLSQHIALTLENAQQSSTSSNIWPGSPPLPFETSEANPSISCLQPGPSAAAFSSTHQVATANPTSPRFVPSPLIKQRMTFRSKSGTSPPRSPQKQSAEFVSANLDSIPGEDDNQSDARSKFKWSSEKSIESSGLLEDNAAVTDGNNAEMTTRDAPRAKSSSTFDCIEDIHGSQDSNRLNDNNSSSCASKDENSGLDTAKSGQNNSSISDLSLHSVTLSHSSDLVEECYITSSTSMPEGSITNWSHSSDESNVETALRQVLGLQYNRITCPAESNPERKFVDELNQSLSKLYLECNSRSSSSKRESLNDDTSTPAREDSTSPESNECQPSGSRSKPKWKAFRKLVKKRKSLKKCGKYSKLAYVPKRLTPVSSKPAPFLRRSTRQDVKRIFLDALNRQQKSWFIGGQLEYNSVGSRLAFGGSHSENSISINQITNPRSSKKRVKSEKSEKCVEGSNRTLDGKRATQRLYSQKLSELAEDRGRRSDESIFSRIQNNLRDFFASSPQIAGSLSQQNCDTNFSTKSRTISYKYPTVGMWVDVSNSSGENSQSNPSVRLNTSMETLDSSSNELENAVARNAFDAKGNWVADNLKSTEKPKRKAAGKLMSLLVTVKKPFTRRNKKKKKKNKKEEEILHEKISPKLSTWRKSRNIVRGLNISKGLRKTFRRRNYSKMKKRESMRSKSKRQTLTTTLRRTSNKFTRNFKTIMSIFGLAKSPDDEYETLSSGCSSSNTDQ